MSRHVEIVWDANIRVWAWFYWDSCPSNSYGHVCTTVTEFSSNDRDLLAHKTQNIYPLGMAEPGGLPPMGSHRVGHDWSRTHSSSRKSLPISRPKTSSVPSRLNSCSGLGFYFNVSAFCCSVAQDCLILWDPMDCRHPGLPVPHHLLEFSQVHVYCISGAIQPSHPLMPSFPSALNLSQHQGLFHWVSC